LCQLGFTNERMESGCRHCMVAVFPLRLRTTNMCTFISTSSCFWAGQIPLPNCVYYIGLLAFAILLPTMAYRTLSVPIPVYYLLWSHSASCGDLLMLRAPGILALHVTRLSAIQLRHFRYANFRMQGTCSNLNSLHFSNFLKSLKVPKLHS
jgi:hypothetical protein